MKIIFPVLIVVSLATTACSAQQKNNNNPAKSTEPRIIPAAERIPVYVPLIRGKKVGLFANQTSMVGKTHLVDTLRKLGIDIQGNFRTRAWVPWKCQCR